MMQKVVGNYRLFCAGFVDIFSEKEIPLDKVLVMFLSASPNTARIGAVSFFLFMAALYAKFDRINQQ